MTQVAFYISCPMYSTNLPFILIASICRLLPWHTLVQPVPTSQPVASFIQVGMIAAHELKGAYHFTIIGAQMTGG